MSTISEANNFKLVTTRFGNDYKLHNGREVSYCCPFCKEKRGKADDDYKFYVNLYSLKFHCFKCNTNGRIENSISVSSCEVYNDILNFLDKDESETEDDENMFYIPNIQIPKDSLAYEYCQKRGITDEIIDFYNIRLGVGDLFGRIVIPNKFYDAKKEWCDMYSARSYINQIPKYKNPDGVKKSNVVFNIENVKEGDEIYVCEGVLTAIGAGKNAVAVFGCHPSETQIQAIIDKDPKSIICSLDNDEAGRPNNEKLADIFAKRCRDCEVYIVYMPKGLDASDLGEVAYKKFVSRNKKRYFSKVYNDVISYFEV